MDITKIGNNVVIELTVTQLSALLNQINGSNLAELIDQGRVKTEDGIAINILELGRYATIQGTINIEVCSRQLIVRLREEVKPIDLNHWNLPILHRHLVDRPILTEQINCKILDNSSTQLTVLKGLGGTGKTFLATAIVNHADYHVLRVWFNAKTKKELIKQYRHFAMDFQLIPGIKEHSIPNEVLLEQVKRYFISRPGSLIVYDGADNYNTLEKFLPLDTKNVHILITSRTRIWPEDSLVNVTVMTENEAILLARNITRSQESNAVINQLVKDKLGLLPLAIAQASGYILSNSNMTFEKYLILYEDYTTELLAEKTLPVGHKHTPVSLTWKINFDRIKKINFPAIILIEACAFLKNVDIPEDILKEYMQKKGYKEIQYLKAKYSLLDYSLINENPNNKTISIHCLLQEFIRAGININQKKLILRLLAAIFLVTLEKEEYQVLVNQWLLFTHYNQVLAQLLKFKDNSLECATALYKGANIHRRLATQENLEFAICYHQKALLIRKTQQESCKYYIAESFIALGATHNELKGSDNNRKAISYYFEGFKIYIDLNSISLEVASTLHKLGNASRDINEKHINIAINYLNTAEIIFIKLPVNAESSLERGKIAYNQGINYLHLGGETNHRKAIEFFKTALLFFPKDKEPIRHAMTLTYLGETYCCIGVEMYPQAKNAFINAFALEEKTLGVNHPEVAITQYGFGQLYRIQGGTKNFKLAIEKFKMALENQRQLLRNGNPDTARTLFYLGLTYIEIKDFHSGIPLIQEALNHFKTLSLFHYYIKMARQLFPLLNVSIIKEAATILATINELEIVSNSEVKNDEDKLVKTISKSINKILTSVRSPFFTKLVPCPPQELQFITQSNLNLSSSINSQGQIQIMPISTTTKQFGSSFFKPNQYQSEFKRNTCLIATTAVVVTGGILATAWNLYLSRP